MLVCPDYGLKVARFQEQLNRSNLVFVLDRSVCRYTHSQRFCGPPNLLQNLEPATLSPSLPQIAGHGLWMIQVPRSQSMLYQKPVCSKHLHTRPAKSMLHLTLEYSSIFEHSSTTTVATNTGTPGCPSR